MRHLKKNSIQLNLIALLILILMLAACEDGNAAAGGQKNQASASGVQTEAADRNSDEPAAAAETDKEAGVNVEGAADPASAAANQGTAAANQGTAAADPASAAANQGTAAANQGTAAADPASAAANQQPAGADQGTAAADSSAAADAERNSSSVSTAPARELEITRQPVEAAVKAGDSVVFQVSAEGEGLTYRWQVRQPNREEWRDTDSDEGFDTSELTIPETTSKRDNFSYRCQITDQNGNTVYSDSANLYVLAIKSSPDNQYVKADRNATFRVSASGKDLSYSWEYCRDSGDVWQKSSAKGHDTAALKVSNIPVGHNGFRYRCAVTDAAGNKAYSNAAGLYVLGVTGDPSDQYAKQGGGASFKVRASGKGLKYRWFVKLPGEEEWRKADGEGKDASTLKLQDLSSSKDNRRYRCRITDAAGNEVYSKAAALYVLGVTADPTTEYVKNSATAYFVVKATGKGLKYRWLMKLPGEDEWRNANEEGSNTSVLKLTNIPGSKNNRSYRCAVTDEKGNKVYSKSAKLFVLTIKKSPSSRDVNENSKVSLTVSATGGGLKYQWQMRKSENHSWHNWTGSGNKSRTIKVTATTANHRYQFRCAVSDRGKNTVYSNTATLFVFGITDNPRNKSVKEGQTAAFHVSATGRGLKYQWQVKSGSNGNWKTASNSGNRTNKLKVTAKKGYNGYYYRCKVSDKKGRTKYSKAAKLTVTKKDKDDEGNNTITPAR